MSLQGLVVAIVAGKALVFLDSFGVGPVAMVDRISAALRKDQLSRPDLSSVPPLDDVRRGEQRDNLNPIYFEKRSFSSSGSRWSLTQRRSAMTKGSRFRRASKSATRRVRSSALAWQW